MTAASRLHPRTWLERALGALRGRSAAPPTRRRATLAPRLGSLLGERCCTVLDVGARWGNDDAWYRIAPLAKVVGFEPDVAECARLNEGAAGSGARFVPVALGREAGRVRLHVTAEPGCSSLLPPNERLTRRYAALRVARHVGEAMVDVVSLDEWAASDGCADVRFLKLDVQGAELDVLRGAERTLAGCLGLEVEVEFMPIYEGQPLFADVDAHLRARGFTLWRLSHLVHYTEQPSAELGGLTHAAYDNVHVSAPAGAGRLAWAHALYFRDYRTDDGAAALGHRDAALLAALLDAADDADGARGALAAAAEDPALSAADRAAFTRLAAAQHA